MMGPLETPSSPAFPVLDPIIVDDEMENAYRDSDMDFLDPSRLQMSSERAGREFDDFFPRAPSSRTVTESETSCLSPSELSIKKHYQSPDTLTQPHLLASDPPSDSPENSSRSSSSESPRNHPSNQSFTSSNSPGNGESAILPFGYSGDWINSDLVSVKDDMLFGLDSGAFAVDADIESSNKVMDASFDFESAASSPSPLKTGATPQPKVQARAKSQLRNNQAADSMVASPLPASGSSFLAHGLPDVSPFSMPTLTSQGRSASSQWGGRSPSSMLEESFGGINMNGGSPLNPAMSPNLNFGPRALSFGMNFMQSPPQANARLESPPRHILTVHPTSLKSRVETQIPIRLTLYPLPAGVKKLRLPAHTISKPKFLARPSVERSAEILELHTSLVCTSAMRDPEKMKRAFARARGEVVDRSSSSSPKSSDDSQEEELLKPLEGGEVKICNGCIQRERKRASRKKQRKPEEDELFRKDEEKRVIVFNTNEIKEWAEPSPNAVSGFGDIAAPIIPAGAMQVELPMRIACYCRHQSEKLGFQVIFTVKDHMDNIIAQAITNSIMITDDHKTHAPAAPPVSSPALPDGTPLPGIGVFPSGPSLNVSKAQKAVTQPSFRPSHSATDLHGLQQRFSPQYPPTPSPFAVPQNSAIGPSNAHTPRNLSRQASPTDFPAPSSKRRKHSNSGKLPSELTMTKLETPQSSSLPSSTPGIGNALFPSAHAFASPTERPFVTPSPLSGQFANSPPTPSSSDNNPFFNPTAQRQTFDSLVHQQMMSAPNSTHPSRPGSPGPSARKSFQDQNFNLGVGPSTASHMWPPLTNTANRLPSVIHKLVPAEGSITGGTEVTLLGSGFYPGMEVVFGDTLATTTTFWGDKCLNCLTPPALRPGLVSVVFKHEHPTFGQVQQPQLLMPKQQLFFRYVDDRELQMYRLALGILGHKLGNQADAFQTARQIMGSDPNSLFSLQKDYQGGSGGHQRQVPGLDSQDTLSDLDSKMLTYLEFVDLDDSPRPPRYNARSATGQTLLHFASSLGLTRFVAGLLARGANPDVQDNIGNTPMHLAALKGHAHIVHRLRLTGANANARSVRGYTPADLATTLPAHQAALIPSRRYRSRSVGSLTSSRRRHSSASVSSLWETSSASGSFDIATDDSDDGDEDADSEDYVQSRRPSVHQDAGSSRFYSRSREGSVQPVSTPTEQTVQAEDARGFSPPAAVVAWRNHLATQINQFQQNVANAFPNLPALPPMPTLPDYQAYPMMRRITNLVPHRPNTARSAKEGWWDLLKGNSAPANTSQPPSYEELYPHNEGEEEEATRVKKASLLQAATEAALDRHFESQASTSAAAGAKEEIKDIRIGRKSISREQQKQLREQQARRMKGLGSDRNLYFIWIPLLLLVICAWVKNFIPDIWQGVSEGYEFVKARYTRPAANITL